MLASENGKLKIDLSRLNFLDRIIKKLQKVTFIIQLIIFALYSISRKMDLKGGMQVIVMGILSKVKGLYLYLYLLYLMI